MRLIYSDQSKHWVASDPTIRAMPKGVKITSDITGDGREARRGDVVVVNLRMFLNKGEEVTAEYPESPRTLIDLGQRETIAGIRYGIEGMREGGKRTFAISPHLAYGDKGLGEWIPPQAVLRCEVELMEVHHSGYREPRTSDGNDLINVFIPGSVGDGKVRCQVSIRTDGSGSAFITRPRPDGSWRRCSMTPVWLRAQPEQCVPIIEEMRALPSHHPDQCIGHNDLWSDSSEPANGITRDQKSDTPCITISFGNCGSTQEYFALRCSSPIWRESATRAGLLTLLAGHVSADEIY